MIKSLRIKNFQSHKDTLLEFHPGITAIIGQSCAGKSALFRGFRWITDNRPLGNSFISYWNRKKDGTPKDDSRIDMVFDDVIISRWKNESENAYGVDDVKLLTVGTDVPDAVSAAHGLTDLHINRQLDPHFMLSLSAGEVAKYLNKLVNLDIIDVVLAKADAQQRQIRASIVADTDIITNATLVVNAYPFLDEAEKIIADLKKREEAIKSKVDSMQKLAAWVVALRMTETTIVPKKELHDRALWYVSIMAVANSEEASVSGKIQHLTDIISKLCHFDILLNNADKIRNGKELTTTITKYSLAVTETSKDISKLTSTIMGVLAYAKKAKDLSRCIAELKKELPSQCPTCGKPLEECNE